MSQSQILLPFFVWLVFNEMFVKNPSDPTMKLTVLQRGGGPGLSALPMMSLQVSPKPDSGPMFDGFFWGGS